MAAAFQEGFGWEGCTRTSAVKWLDHRDESSCYALSDDRRARRATFTTICSPLLRLFTVPSVHFDGQWQQRLALLATLGLNFQRVWAILPARSNGETSLIASIVMAEPSHSGINPSIWNGMAVQHAHHRQPHDGGGLSCARWSVLVKGSLGAL